MTPAFLVTLAIATKVKRLLGRAICWLLDHRWNAFHPTEFARIFAPLHRAMNCRAYCDRCGAHCVEAFR